MYTMRFIQTWQVVKFNRFLPLKKAKSDRRSYFDLRTLAIHLCFSRIDLISSVRVYICQILRENSITPEKGSFWSLDWDTVMWLVLSGVMWHHCKSGLLKNYFFGDWPHLTLIVGPNVHVSFILIGSWPFGVAGNSNLNVRGLALISQYLFFLVQDIFISSLYFGVENTEHW